MKKQLTKLALTATLGLAITLTFTACEEKEATKKPTEPATTTQETPQEEEAAAKAKAEAEADAAAAEIAAAFASCGKGSGGVKLLECITDKKGKERYYKFGYDEQNRIIKIYGKFFINTITYDGSGSVTVKEVETQGSGRVKKYVKNANTIIDDKDKDTLTIDKDGYIVKLAREFGSLIYKYEDGNLTGIENDSHFSSYDNKKSPFSNSNTPKWFIQLLAYVEGDAFASKNNPLSKAWFGGEVSGSCTYKYEYDSDDFPITNTNKCEVEGEEITNITRFVYRGETKKTN